MLRIVVVLCCDNTSKEEDFFECNNYSAEAVVAASVGAAAAVEVEENPVGHCGCGCCSATTDSSLLPIYRRRKGKREETGETGNAWQTGGKVLLLRVSLTFAQVFLLLTKLRRRRAVSRPLFSWEHSSSFDEHQRESRRQQRQWQLKWSTDGQVDTKHSRHSHRQTRLPQ